MDILQQFKNLELAKFQAQAIRGGNLSVTDEWLCHGDYYGYKAKSADDAIDWCNNPANYCIYCEPVGQ
ncbi:MAG TPA: hypothetical protein DCS93_12310 [Microscillaceae bacterium]|nr:hypothetical protein [Microscillaceae bacterium]